MDASMEASTPRSSRTAFSARSRIGPTSSSLKFGLGLNMRSEIAQTHWRNAECTFFADSSSTVSNALNSSSTSGPTGDGFVFGSKTSYAWSLLTEAKS